MKEQGMRRKVLKFIEEWNMFDRGDRIMVAVSGGKDSMALLHFLGSERDFLEIDVYAAHFNHGIRRNVGERELGIIRSLCDRLKVPLTVGEENVREHTASAKGESLEQVARRLRHDFLKNRSRELKADRIAMGHHMNDLAETMLMRMARGTGVRGLMGLAPSRKNIIRPFLCLEVQEISSYVTINQIIHSLDDTNVVEVFERNFVRNRILPELNKLNPRATRSLYRLFENAHDMYQFVKTCVRRELEDFHQMPGVLFQRVDKLMLMDNALVAEIARHIVSVLDESSYPPSRERIGAFLECLLEGSSRWTIEFKGDIKASRIGGYVFFYRGELDIPAERNEARVTELPFHESFQMGRVSLELKSESPGIVDGKGIAVCSKNELRFPLKIRKANLEDRMIPFGMDRAKTVKSIVREAGETAFMDQMLVLEDGTGRILWIPGVRASELCRTRRDSETVVVFSLERR